MWCRPQFAYTLEQVRVARGRQTYGGLFFHSDHEQEKQCFSTCRREQVVTKSNNG